MIQYIVYLLYKIRYGIFSVFWKHKPHYLPFLNFSNSHINDEKCNLKISLNLLEKIFNSFPKEIIIKRIRSLLSSRDWRPHLVAIVAILKLKLEEQLVFCETLWDLSEKKNSWVRPQILATLSIIDTKFIDKSRMILGRNSSEGEFKNRDDEIEYLLEKLSQNQKYSENLKSIAFDWRKKVKENFN